MIKPTIIVQLPVIDSSSEFTLADRITNECDVKWSAGYQLVASCSPSPASVILIFQLPVE